MNNDIKFWKGGHIASMTGNNIFVFGSNPEGRHGAGAAKAAMNFGAVYGQGRGLQGNAYALVTKNLTENYYEQASGITYEREGMKSISPQQIYDNIKELYQCAVDNPHLKFFIGYMNDGNNLNGYDSEEMFRFFVENQNVPSNIRFHESFKELYKQMLSEDSQLTEGFTFFWKSTSIYSQWYPAKFEETINDQKYTFMSAEQYMIFRKALLFNDTETANKIMHYNESKLGKAFLGGLKAEEILNDDLYLGTWNKIQKKFKSLGREIKNFDEKTWIQNREKIVKKGTFLKFEQNPDIKKELQFTGKTRMVEASPYDKIWGVGLGVNDPKIKNPSQWKGLNLLGDIITSYKFYLYSDKKNTNKIKNTP